MSRRYRIYGLETDSAIDLGDLAPGDARLPVDLRIEVGDVPPLASGMGQWFENRDGAILVDLPPSGRFLVRDGTRITVDGIDAGVAALRWRLLGIASGALLHQRGTLPLHCTAVRVHGCAIGLVGASGAGKSTLAAYLQTCGHSILIDDVCAVSAIGPGGVWVEPGNGLLRLWDDAGAALGVSGGAPLDPDIAKFEHRLAPIEAGPIELAALIEVTAGETLALTALDAAERLSLCLRHTYCREVMASLGRKQSNFVQCAGVASHIPGYRLTRPKGFELLPAVAARIEAGVAGLGAQAA